MKKKKEKSPVLPQRRTCSDTEHNFLTFDCLRIYCTKCGEVRQIA